LSNYEFQEYRLGENRTSIRGTNKPLSILFTMMFRTGWNSAHEISG